MGQTAIYKCRKCGNKFEASEGGGLSFVQYRCIKCDAVKTIRVNYVSIDNPTKYTPPSKEQIGVCRRCGSKLSDNLRPMCPACKSRKVTEEEILAMYD